MSLSVLTVEERDAIATHTLNRPKTTSTSPARLRVIFAQTSSEFQGDTRTRLIAPSGTGRVLCAGTDLKEVGGARSCDARKGCIR